MVWVRRMATAAWRWSGTRWLLLAVAAVAVAGWAVELRPVAPVWGPVGTWVGGLATAGALLFTGTQLRDARLQQRREHEDRRREEEERRRAMARSVTVSTVVREVDDAWVVDYTIANGSDVPIENVVLVVADPDLDDVRPEDRVGTCLHLRIGTLHHKEVVSDDYGPVRMKRAPFGEIAALGSIHFTDAWGQSWWRGDGELKSTVLPAGPR